MYIYQVFRIDTNYEYLNVTGPGKKIFEVLN